ncbi:MAG: FHA domain-containing protein [Planctomycetota bacterium]
MSKLIVNQNGASKEYELGSEPLTCGRSNSADITISDDQASREHCRFELEDGKWYVADLGSSNGTLIDEERITRHELANGTVVRIGRTDISFVDEERPAPPPLELEPAVEPGLSLRANGGPCDGEVFKIKKAVTTIGRGPNSDITLAESPVSGNHAELVMDGGRVRIVDKNSRNGVCVNGVHVGERDLDVGDEIHIGSTTLVLFTGDDASAGIARPPDESSAPEAARAAAPTALTPRVKILAAVVALILLAGIAVKFLAPSGPGHRIYPDNLLTENPSFEKTDATPGKIPGWRPGQGSAGLTTSNVRDGKFALRLVAAAGAGDDVSALCWSTPVNVSPKKTYELSALVRNSGTEAAALCVAWDNREHPWLQSLYLGSGRTTGSLEWQRVSEAFEPPSWAKSARFGCAIVGQGQVRFDGFRLTDADRPGAPRRIAAGRIAFETTGRGEFTLFADDQPMLGRGRVVAADGGRQASQSLGALDSPPAVRSSMAKYVGRLGLDGKVRFSEAISSDGAEAALHYDVDISAVPDAVVALEWRSPKSLLTGSILLQTSHGAQSVQKTFFENRGNVSLVTFFSGSKRVFLRFGSPATITAAEAAGNTVAWHMGFPSAARSGRVSISLVWLATDRKKGALIAADLQRAAKAEDAEQFGEAVKIYQEFLRKYPLYAAEGAQAAAQLQGVREEIAGRVKLAEDLATRALASQSEADFSAAERTYEALIEKCDGLKEAERIAGLLAALKREHKAAVESQRAQEAANLVASAKRHIERKEFNIARAECEYVLSKFPNTPSAAEARLLLKKLPEDE